MLIGNKRNMSPNRRIFLNIVATYGRSLYALVIGLFCGRWTLMALGEVDYGLYGVVGGMTAFVSFLNGVMAGGVGRFYAVSVGAALLPLIWFFMFDDLERSFVRSKLLGRLPVVGEKFRRCRDGSPWI